MLRSARLAILLVNLVLLPGCTSLLTGNGKRASGEAMQKFDIPFAAPDKLRLDVYVPEHATGDVVVFLYGGHWSTGDKDQYRFVGHGLTSRGFVAVIANYRTYPEATFPTFVEDAALAVKWTHDQIAEFGGDPKRVYLAGHSAGAHIAALLNLDEHYLKDIGLDRTALRGAIPLAGPMAFMPWKQDRAAFNLTDADTSPPDDTQPVKVVDGKAPPMLILQGKDDKTVKPYNAVVLRKAIRAAGGEATSILYTYTTHVKLVAAMSRRLSFLAPVLDDIRRYVDHVDASPVATTQSSASP